MTSAPPRLDDRQRQRYARHLALPEVGEGGQARLLAARVAVIGVGGLGNPCLLYLAAAGVGTLGLIDGDRVERSNLQRQILFGEEDVGRLKVARAAAALARVNPEIRLVEHPVMLSSANALELLRGYEVVVNGCDNFPTRYLVNDACQRLGLPLVDASLAGFEGRVAVYAPGQGCYRCLFPDPPPAGLAPPCAEAGVFGALAGALGALQALEVLKLLLGIGRPLADRLWLHSADAAESRTLKRAPDPACPACGAAPRTRPKTMKEETMSEIPELEPDEARRALEADPRIQLIDVREPEEHALYHLPGARLIPLGEIEARAGELDPGRPVFTVCARGRRSLSAAGILLERGFAEVTSLAGGTEGWKDAGLPLVHP